MEMLINILPWSFVSLIINAGSKNEIEAKDFKDIALFAIPLAIVCLTKLSYKPTKISYIKNSLTLFSLSLALLFLTLISYWKNTYFVIYWTLPLGIALFVVSVIYFIIYICVQLYISLKNLVKNKNNNSSQFDLSINNPQLITQQNISSQSESDIIYHFKIHEIKNDKLVIKIPDDVPSQYVKIGMKFNIVGPIKAQHSEDELFNSITYKKALVSVTYANHNLFIASITRIYPVLSLGLEVPIDLETSKSEIQKVTEIKSISLINRLELFLEKNWTILKIYIKSICENESISIDIEKDYIIKN